MITVKINDVNYLVPQKWEDLNWEIGVNLIVAIHNNADYNSIITILTGISSDTINSLSVKSAETLINLVSFIDDLSILNDLTVKEEYKDFDYGSLTYGQSEKVRQLIDVKKSYIENTAPVFNYLFNVDLNQEPFAEWIGTANFFLNSWVSFSMGSVAYQKLSKTLKNNRLELIGLTDSEVSELALS